MTVYVDTQEIRTTLERCGLQNLSAVLRNFAMEGFADEVKLASMMLMCRERKHILPKLSQTSS